MIGPKNLSDIRQQIRRAQKASTVDVIDLLNQRMAEPTESSREVLDSLRRILDSKGKSKRLEQK